jgi:3-mercaptopyruvate sulfurtransferase SseA
VVAYDEAAEGGAARLWWLLRAHGHDRVAVLAVGLRGWRAEGGELRAAPPQAGPLPLDFREAAELAQRALRSAQLNRQSWIEVAIGPLGRIVVWMG